MSVADAVLGWACFIGFVIVIVAMILHVDYTIRERQRRAWREQVRREAEEHAERLRRGR